MFGRDPFHPVSMFTPTASDMNRVGKTTTSYKAEEGSQASSPTLSQRHRLSISSLVNSPTTPLPGTKQESKSKSSTLEDGVESFQHLRHRLFDESDMEKVRGLKRKADDMDDADDIFREAVDSAHPSENKASLKYALNYTAPSELERPADPLLSNVEEQPLPVEDSTNLPSPADPGSTQSVLVHPPVERPAKRLRTVLGYAGTVAASVAVGAIAVIGGLTTLPEGFFE